MTEENMFVTPIVTTKPRRRSSFFGFDLPESTNTSVQQKTAEEFYLQKLKEEERDWPKMLQQCNIKARDFWRKQKELMTSTDISTLSKDKQEYLAKAVNMDEYVKEVNLFCAKVDEYATQKQWLYRRYEYALSQLEDELVEAQSQKIANN